MAYKMPAPYPKSPANTGSTESTGSTLPAKTTPAVKIALLLALPWVIGLLFSPGKAFNLSMILFFLAIAGGIQYVHGLRCEATVKDKFPHLIPQGPLGRLVPENLRAVALKRIPILFSPYARMEEHAEFKAFAYARLSREQLLGSAVNQREQSELRDLGSASSLADLGEVLSFAEQEIAGEWNGRDEKYMMTRLLTADIEALPFKAADKAFYLTRYLPGVVERHKPL